MEVNCALRSVGMTQIPWRQYQLYYSQFPQPIDCLAFFRISQLYALSESRTLTPDIIHSSFIMDALSAFEKSKSPEYMPVDASSEGDNEDDSLMNHRWKPVNSRMSRVYVYAARVSGVLIYTILLVTVTSWWWQRERLHGPGVIKC